MKKYIWPVVLIVVAVVLIAVGIMLNQPADVLHKAAKICMECVGLG